MSASQNFENSLSNDFEQNENQIQIKKNINIQLEIFTEILLKNESKTKCICHNYIKDIENKNNVFIEKEIIPNVEIICIQTSKENFSINLQNLINKLKFLGFTLDGSNINIFHPFFNVYVPFGIEPIDQNVLINNEYFFNNFIQMKIINYIESSIIEKFYNNDENEKNNKKNIRNNELIEIDEEDDYYDNNSKFDFNEDFDSEEEKLNIVKEENEENNNFITNFSSTISTEINNNKNNSKKIFISKRRERRIEYIIEKVFLWRKYYNGFSIKGKFTKFDTNKAAKLVGVSKKSLDDYTKLIRIGRKLKYDFNKNRNKRISHLKTFIKQNC